MKILNDKEKEEVKFIDTAIQNYDRELAKFRGHIKLLLEHRQKMLDIKKRLLKG